MLQKTASKIKKLGQAIKAIETVAHEKACALLLAGGSGTRMGDDGLPKQHRLLFGIPIVVRSALALQEAETVDEIVAVIRDGEEALYEGYVRDYSLTKLRRFVVGGKTRQESAMRGLEALPEGCKYVAIHDAARCLVTPSEVDAVVSDAIVYKAATAAAQSVDTVKLSDPSGGFTLSEGQPSRSHVYIIQTPQVFDADLYRAAVTLAADKKEKTGVEITDDCALIEQMGGRCRLTLCSRQNFKITTEEDLLLAEAILRRREESAQNSTQ